MHILLLPTLADKITVERTELKNCVHQSFGTVPIIIIKRAALETLFSTFTKKWRSLSVRIDSSQQWWLPYFWLSPLSCQTWEGSTQTLNPKRINYKSSLLQRVTTLVHIVRENGRHRMLLLPKVYRKPLRRWETKMKSHENYDLLRHKKWKLSSRKECSLLATPCVERRRFRAWLWAHVFAWQFRRDGLVMATASVQRLPVPYVARHATSWSEYI